MISSSLYRSCIFYLFFYVSVLIQCGVVVVVEAYPWAAGHCSSGDLSGKYSGHGESGGGPLPNGQLQVKFDNIVLSPSFGSGTSTGLNINANQEYTVTLEFAYPNDNFFFRGLLFRLSNANSPNAAVDDDTLFVIPGSNGDGVQDHYCPGQTSAVTHTDRNNKTQVQFKFLSSTTVQTIFNLEVTVVRERAANNWFYSNYKLNVQPTITPTTMPSTASVTTLSPSTTPSVAPTITSIAPTTMPSTASVTTLSPSTTPSVAPTITPIAPTTMPSTASVTTLSPSILTTTICNKIW